MENLVYSVAKLLDVSVSSIKSIESWVNVIYVKFHKGRSTFVSKKKLSTDNLNFYRPYKTHLKVKFEFNPNVSYSYPNQIGFNKSFINIYLGYRLIGQINGNTDIPSSDVKWWQDGNFKIAGTFVRFNESKLRFNNLKDAVETLVNLNS